MFTVLYYKSSRVLQYCEEKKIFDSFHSFQANIGRILD